MTQKRAKFVTGSTMRHVIVMTMSGMMGLTFMFLVDAATLFWVSKLNVEMFIAAMGFAWTIQFFCISTAVGLMIAATARVSRSLGRGDFEKARIETSVAAAWSVLLLILLAGALFIFRYDVLKWAGAEGDTLEVAATFLAISVPSLPIMTVGMIGSATLRAEGDALRSMWVTMSAGIVAMIVDPVLIFGFDMGVNGAAYGVVISRSVSAVIAVYFVIFVKNLAGPIGISHLRSGAWPFFIIALPAGLTQVSTPFGNYLATRVIADFGEAAVAGWAVMGRVLVVAFGGIYSLSGAIGGIIGQNFGAEQYDRVRDSYRDALLFSVFYVMITWAIVALCTPFIIDVFGLSPEAANVFKAFSHVAAGAFVFFAALYVSNAAFNNLDRPLYSTTFNWIRDGVLMWPLCVWAASIWGAPGVVYGQSMAGTLVGIVSVIFGWRFIAAAEQRARIKANKVNVDAGNSAV